MADQRTRPHPETKQTGLGPVRGPSPMRRFEIISAAGRTLQGWLRPLRTILIVLAIITLGIVAYAQWLAFQPNPSPAATLAALNRARYEEAFATKTVVPTAPPTAIPPAPTDTSTPKPTKTLVPLPTSRPRNQPTATEPPSSPTAVPAPRLVAPADGVTAFDTMLFEWAWDGPPLKQNQAFDLRIWSAQEEQAGGTRRGVAPPTRETKITVSLPAVPAILDYGPGEYLWSVVVVEVGADGATEVVGVWGQSWRLVYR